MKKIFALILTLALVLSAAAFAEGTIKIAVAGPMTGSNAAYGIGFANAAKLKASEWNAKGGVTVGDETYTVEIVEYDDKNESDEAAIIAEDIVSDPNIWGVIGHFSSGVCMVAAPTYQDAEYVNISPTSSHADYSGIGDYIFRNNALITVETATGADIAVNDLKAQAIGVLSIDTEWGVSAGDAMEANVAELGGTVVLRQEVSAQARDFATEIANFKDANVDVVMIAGQYETVAPFAVACANSNYDVELIGCSNSYDYELINIAGEAAEGVYAPVSFFSGNPDPAVQAYVAAYTETYGAAPSSLTTQAYDSTGILLQAIEEAGVLDREAIRDAVAAIDYAGITGQTSFNEIGDAQKVFTKIVVKDGDFALAEF